MGPKYFPGNLVHENNNIRLRRVCALKSIFGTKLPNEYSYTRHIMTYSKWRLMFRSKMQNLHYKRFVKACLQALRRISFNWSEKAIIYLHFREVFVLGEVFSTSNGLFLSVSSGGL